jgi:D-alanyl-lipoteichoic acid acyltransferase DltB (MBOAT superfamily)
MNFTTATFLIFLPLVFAIYWLLRERTAQNALLLIASYTFYGWWDARFCLLMLAASLIDYYMGLAIERTERQNARRWLLGISMVANLGLLGVFKYYNFFAESAQVLADSIGWNVSPATLNIVLPVGISFYTFQTMSYTIDIYRRELKACRSLVDYLSFVSFFPQLVAGPIERGINLLTQFSNPRTFKSDEAREGCRQILWGFFKKVVVADRLAVLVDERYADPSLISGPELALATVLFAFQIYCDFSAYSEIAIGTGKLFGIRLMRNFAYPYFSQSIGEFWRRWHISLSTWFRDYLFVPLGGSRVSGWRRALNVMITFVVSGLWHGAAWPFVVWGGINGGAVVAAQCIRPRKGEKTVSPTDVPGGERLIPHPITAFKILGTFALVCLTWVFFRAESMGDALLILQKMAVDAFSVSGYLDIAAALDSNKALRTTIIVLAIFVAVEWLQRRQECPLEISHWPLPLRWATYTAILWVSLDLVPRSGGQEFIYFEF